jgi:hypothetical protein
MLLLHQSLDLQLIMQVVVVVAHKHSLMLLKEKVALIIQVVAEVMETQERHNLVLQTLVEAVVVVVLHFSKEQFKTLRQVHQA